jgi:hypothetical protein
MIDKQMILDSMLKEINVVKHLATKVPAGKEDFRPSEKQRSTLELLRYLSYCGVSGLKAALATDWEIGKRMSEAANKLTLKDIPAALDREANELKDLFAQIKPEDLAQKMVARPGQDPMPLGRFILDSAFKYLPSYKMQLFLNLKASGRPELSTPNLWRGEDPK